MKKTILFLLSATLLSLHAQTFTLKSKDIGGQATNKEVYNGLGCTGENVSPQLSWENIPADTKSFAVTMYDMDAGWWHWVIFDIPASIYELKTGAGNIEKKLAPLGSIQSMTDFGHVGYGGPCPPASHSFHAYIFTVYALNVEKMGRDKNTSAVIISSNLNANLIAKASIIMYYKR